MQKGANPRIRCVEDKEGIVMNIWVVDEAKRNGVVDWNVLELVRQLSRRKSRKVSKEGSGRRGQHNLG